MISAQKIQRSCLIRKNLFGNERSVHDNYVLKPKENMGKVLAKDRESSYKTVVPALKPRNISTINVKGRRTLKNLNVSAATQH